MMTLHDMKVSGNCYKIRLLCALLHLPFKSVAIEPSKGQSSTDSFLAKNPKGMVPFLEYEDGRTLAESNAILLHLSEETPYLPRDAFERAKVYEWLFFEQYSHEPNIAVRISLLTVPERQVDATPERLAALMKSGLKALHVMEKQLAVTRFLTGDTFTIADIALFAYTHKAKNGGFDLDTFASIQRWVADIKKLEKFVDMDWLPPQS